MVTGGHDHGWHSLYSVRPEAYALCSVAVDAPNWVVGAFLPDDVFVEGAGR